MSGRTRQPGSVRRMVQGSADRRFRPLVQRFARTFRSPSTGAARSRCTGAVNPSSTCGPATPTRAGSAPWERETAAMSFSTTKGIASTVVHRFVDRGLLTYDDPLATWWPAFATDDKRHITLRPADEPPGRAAPHPRRGPDRRGAARPPVGRRPRRRPATGQAASEAAPGYHGLTYGWLVAGLVQRVAGIGLGEAVQKELAGTARARRVLHRDPRRPVAPGRRAVPADARTLALDEVAARIAGEPPHPVPRRGAADRRLGAAGLRPRRPAHPRHRDAGRERGVHGAVARARSTRRSPPTGPSTASRCSRPRRSTRPAGSSTAAATTCSACRCAGGSATTRRSPPAGRPGRPSGTTATAGRARGPTPRPVSRSPS